MILGAKSGVATVGASDTVAAKARLAAVVAMKRELLKARKAARDEEKLASARFTASQRTGIPFVEFSRVGDWRRDAL